MKSCIKPHVHSWGSDNVILWSCSWHI